MASSSSFSTPHAQAFHGAQLFYTLLEREMGEAEARVAELGGGEEAMLQAYAPGALQRQALSEAVQVFAAMAVEGAINLLGVMVLGEEQFFRRLAKKGQRDRLKELLELINSEASEHAERATAAARRLADARNSFVHPRPQEGPPRFEDGRRGDLPSARGAMRDMHEFFSELQQCDRRYAIFFVLV